MKILHINTSDISGGASWAAYRIHKGLQEIRIDSNMLVQKKLGNDRTVMGPENQLTKGINRLRPVLDATVNKIFAGGAINIFSSAWIPFSDILSRIHSINPDIVHLHWICKGMVRIEDLKRINRPIVWTLHDMWPFTGGCHYSKSCERFENDCGHCLQLNRNGTNDLSRSVMRRKKKEWDRIDINIITPSKWLGECAKKSSLFKNRRIEIIHNGLDLNLFKPVDKTIARQIWNLPKNKKLILFGAMDATSDYRKGFDLVSKSLKKLSAKWLNRAELIIFGAHRPDKPPVFGLPAHYLGILHDPAKLSLLYSAADVMAAPSRQDNLPNTVVESLSCGTPVVAFDINGMPDMIVHKTNGYLAKPFDVSDFAAGIDRILADENSHARQSIKAREMAENCFDIKKVAKKYAVLYNSIV